MSKIPHLCSEGGNQPKNSVFLCGIAARGESVPSSNLSTEPLRASSIFRLLASGIIVSRMELSVKSTLPRDRDSSTSVAIISVFAPIQVLAFGVQSREFGCSRGSLGSVKKQIR